MWGFSHYGGVKVRKWFQVGQGWIRLGSLYFGHVKTQMDLEVGSLWAGAVAEANALGQSVTPAHALLSLLANYPDGRAARGLAEHGLTAESAREILRQTPAATPSQLADMHALDIEALEKVGIDYNRVRAALEREFGPEVLEASDQAASAGLDADGVPMGIRTTVHHLAGAAALRFGETRITSEHMVLGLLSAGAVEKLVLEPLGIDAKEVSRGIEHQLEAA